MKDMISKNSFTYLSVITIEILGKIIYFPIWWYSVGLFKKARSLWFFLKYKEKNLGLFIWLKNIFVPMYGQRDFSGRIISFFIRFFQIIFRGLVLFFWLLGVIFMLLAWIALPVFLVFALIFQIF